MAPPPAALVPLPPSPNSNSRGLVSTASVIEASNVANLVVAVRCRPLARGEVAKGVAKVVTTQGNNVIVNYTPGATRSSQERSYHFDKTFSPYATQQHVFESLASPVVDEVLAGFNCTVFAYGPTGTGKTHTMEGRGEGEEAGIITRCARAIFERLERRKDADFSLRVSCLEVYNEEMTDLLFDAKAEKTKEKRRPLRLVSQDTSNTSKGVVCANLEELVCESLDDCLGALRKAATARSTAATLCNDKSSRSHAIYCLKVCVRSLADDGRDLVTNGQLNLVDLAGSECVGRSGATAGRAREAGSINQSLLTLGRVITALVQKGDTNYVPYRDSKLTRLLQESLGGRAKTTLIATVSPGRDAVEETLSTLQYALRARSIENKPEQRATYRGKTLLKAHSQEVDELQRMLRCTREKTGGITVPNEKWEAMCADLESRRQELSEVTEAMEGARIEKVEAERVRDELRQELEVQVQRTAEQTQRTAEVEEQLASEKRAHVEARREHECQVGQGRVLRSAMGDCLGDLQRSLASLEKEAAALRDAKRRTGEAASAILESKETLHAAAERQQSLLSKLSAEAEEQASELVGASRDVNEQKDGLIESCLEADKRRMEREFAAHAAFNKSVAADVNEAVERAATALGSAAAAAHAASASLDEGVRGLPIGKIAETLDVIRSQVASADSALDADMLVLTEIASAKVDSHSRLVQMSRVEQARRVEEDRAFLSAQAAEAERMLMEKSAALKRSILELLERDSHAASETLRTLAAAREACERKAVASSDESAHVVESSLETLKKELAEATEATVEKAHHHRSLLKATMDEEQLTPLISNAVAAVADEARGGASRLASAAQEEAEGALAAARAIAVSIEENAAAQSAASRLTLEIAHSDSRRANTEMQSSFSKVLEDAQVAQEAALAESAALADETAVTHAAALGALGEVAGSQRQLAVSHVENHAPSPTPHCTALRVVENAFLSLQPVMASSDEATPLPPPPPPKIQQAQRTSLSETTNRDTNRPNSSTRPSSH